MAPQWLQSANSYKKSLKAYECYESVSVSRKILSQTHPLPTLIYKEQFAYEWVYSSIIYSILNTSRVNHNFPWPTVILVHATR
jgi:hypothetical protein